MTIVTNKPVTPATATPTAATLQSVITGMFRQHPDGYYRGEVTGLSDSTQGRMQTDMAGFARRLAAPVIEGMYKPTTLGLVAISKSKGGHRFIAPPRDTDRIIQRAILKIVMPGLKPLFHPMSFGFIPGRGVLDALLAVEQIAGSGKYDTVIIMDVVRCFPSILIERLMAQFQMYIKDKGLLAAIGASYRARPHPALRRLMERELRRVGTGTDADYANLRGMYQSERGLPEGSPLSPMGCSIYLAIRQRTIPGPGHRIHPLLRQSSRPHP